MDMGFVSGIYHCDLQQLLLAMSSDLFWEES